MNVNPSNSCYFTHIPPQVEDPSIQSDQIAQSICAPFLVSSNQIEDLMERIENLLSKADRYPEVCIPAKKLNQQAAILRRAEPNSYSLGSIEVNNYLSTVNRFLEEAALEFAALEKLFVILKIERIKMQQDAETQIRALRNAFEGVFNEANSLSPTPNVFHGILTTRLSYWDSREQKVSKAEDLKTFNNETLKQGSCDLIVLSLIEDEILRAKNTNQPVQGCLEILSQLSNPLFLSKRANEAFGKFNIPPLTESELVILIPAIAEIFVQARKKADLDFIQTLVAARNHFEKSGYKTVVDYYDKTIVRLEAISQSLDKSSVEKYSEEWNSLITKFLPNHEQLVKLKDNNKLMNFFVAVANEVLKKNIQPEDNASVLHEKLKAINTFMEEHPEPINVDEVDAYRKEVEAFLKKIEVQV